MFHKAITTQHYFKPTKNAHRIEASTHITHFLCLSRRELRGVLHTRQSE